MKGLIAKKVGMTQIFDESGNLTPVTVIQVEPNVVVAKKTKENCGYDAVVLGLEDIKASKANKAYAGQFPENINPKRHLKEFRNYEKEVNVGDVIGSSMPNALAIPFVNNVLPLPNSPSRHIIMLGNFSASKF